MSNKGMVICWEDLKPEVLKQIEEFFDEKITDPKQQLIIVKNVKPGEAEDDKEKQ